MSRTDMLPEDRAGDTTTDVLGTIGATRLLPVLVIEDASTAAPLAAALSSAGLPCAEVTLRTAAAFDAIRVMSADPALALGAGTVLTVAQAERALGAGARYIVTPGFNPSVVQYCRDAGVPVIPGVATATEVQMALDAGLTLVKLFPAETIGGLAVLQALSAPYPMMRFLPTGGIDMRTVDGYLSHRNVLAVGGSWMAPPSLLAQRDFKEITRRAREAVAMARPSAPMA